VWVMDANGKVSSLASAPLVIYRIEGSNIPGDSRTVTINAAGAQRR
jgi:hypothetical protein